MKIAITADPEIPVPPIFYGGIERIIYMLITELTKAGHEVTLFAHKDSKVPCRLIAYPCTGNKTMDVVRNSWVVCKTVLFTNFDVLHSFGRLAYLLPLMPLKTRILMSYQREPTISQVKKAVKLSKPGTIAFTGCSNYITDKIKPFAKANTVYNAVDMDTYTATTEIGTDAPLVFLGRIEPVKGTHTAIAIALQADKKLIIAGNIPPAEQDYFDNEIKPFIGDAITYAGPVNDQQKNHLLGNALALLMPINWNEPFGIVMIEAMACGTPVIGFPHGAVPEVVVNGVNGYVVANQNDAALKAGQVNNLNRAQIRKNVEERFSSNIITRRYLALYQSFNNLHG